METVSHTLGLYTYIRLISGNSYIVETG